MRNTILVVALVALLCTGCKEKIRDMVGTNQLLNNDKETAKRVGGIEDAVVGLTKDVNSIKSSHRKLDAKLEKNIDLTNPEGALYKLTEEWKRTPPRRIADLPSDSDTDSTEPRSAQGTLTTSGNIFGVNVHYTGPGTLEDAKRWYRKDYGRREREAEKRRIRALEAALIDKKAGYDTLASRVSAVETRTSAGEARTAALERDLTSHVKQFEAGLGSLKTTIAERDAAFEKSVKEFAAAHKIEPERVVPVVMPVENVVWYSEGRYTQYCPTRRRLFFGRWRG